MASELSRLSADEMVSALGAANAPRPLRGALKLPLLGLSRRLGEALAELDGSIDELGLPAAAAQALRRFGVEQRPSGAAIASGPCLVLANHPGAYDALALMSAIGRDDLGILAADRTFLRALPRLSRQLLFVSEHQSARAAVLKRTAAGLYRRLRPKHEGQTT